MIKGVPEEVLDAFNLNGDITPVSGGQGTSFRINDAIVKPVEDIPRNEWLLMALSEIRPNGYRLSQFVKSKSGKYIVKGWCCNQFEPGYEVRGRLEAKITISKMFHRDLSEIDFKNFEEGDDTYAKAHRIAWQRDGIPRNVHEKTKVILHDLLGKVRLSDDYKMQIVHSDLSGNILFDDVLSPLIIDFSPKIGPVEYAEAILVCDCIVWEGSPISTIKKFLNSKFHKEMILRALIFRLSISALFAADDFNEFSHNFKPFESIIDYIS